MSGPKIVVLQFRCAWFSATTRIAPGSRC